MYKLAVGFSTSFSFSSSTKLLSQLVAFTTHCNQLYQLCPGQLSVYVNAFIHFYTCICIYTLYNRVPAAFTRALSSFGSIVFDDKVRSFDLRLYDTESGTISELNLISKLNATSTCRVPTCHLFKNILTRRSYCLIYLLFSDKFCLKVHGKFMLQILYQILKINNNLY